MGTGHTCPDGWNAIQLLAYVDGELESAACSQLEQHVKVCPHCARELAALRRMDTLLKEHPEALHPDAENLLRFVSQGEDADGTIAAHLVACPSCRDDVEILGEIIAHRAKPGEELPLMPTSLFHALERSEPPSSPGTLSRILAAAGEWLRLPFRMPVLALGSAATILILAVIGLPVWRSLETNRMSEFQPDRAKTFSGHASRTHAPQKGTAPTDALPAAESKVAETLNATDMTTEKPSHAPARGAHGLLPINRGAEHSEKRELSKSKEAGAPASQNVGIVPSPVPAAPPADSEAAPSGATPQPSALPAPAASAASESGRGIARQEVRAPETGKPALDMTAGKSNVHASHRSAKKDAPRLLDQAGADPSAIVSVAVQITDAQGKPVPWVHVSLPPGLESRFRLAVRGDSELDAVPAQPPSPTESSLDAKAKQAPGLYIEVRIHQAADAYDVDSKLLDAGSRREIASVVSVRVPREAVPGTVETALRQLLEQR